MTPNGKVHAERNQAEYGRVLSGLGAAIQAASRALNYGLLTNIPYHMDHSGDVPGFRVWQYAYAPVVATRGFPGETFLRMQPFYSKPHPTGLLDDFMLRTPRPGE